MSNVVKEKWVLWKNELGVCQRGLLCDDGCSKIEVGGHCYERVGYFDS
jgi:hypothetical protein